MDDILKDLDENIKNAKKAAEKLLIQTMLAGAIKNRKKSIKKKYKGKISDKKSEISEQLDLIITELDELGKGKWAKSAEKKMKKSKKQFE